MTDNVKIALPLFGGGTAYVQTLSRVLEFVYMNNPDKNELINWFKASFAQVSSEDSIDRRITFLKSTDFLMQNENGYTLGPAGSRFHKTKTDDVIYVTLASRVVGFSDILDRIVQSTASDLTIQDICTEFDQDYDQVKWKVNWLRSLRLANQHNSHLFATDRGVEFNAAYPL